MDIDDRVIPGRAQRVRPEMAGPMTSSSARPESITPVCDYGFLARRFAAPPNDPA